MERHSGCALFSGPAMLAAGALLAGCSKPPTEELCAAEAVLDSVKALTDVQT